MNRHVLLSLPLCVLMGGLSAQTVLSANSEASLRTAINTANGAGDFIINVSAGTIAISGAALDNANASGDFDITKASGNLTINGVGPTTVLDGASLDRVFHINGGTTVTVTFSNLVIQNGRATDNGTSQAQEARGGALYVQSSTNLTLSNVTLNNNQARAIDGILGGGGGGFGGSGKAAFGGAIYCAGGTLSIGASTLSQNTSRGGDGGDGVSPANIQGTSICTGANGGGGGNGGTGFGGGVYLASGTLNVTASTLNANTARGGNGGNGAKGGNGSASGVSFSFGRGGVGGFGGGGAQARGGAIYLSTGNVTLTSATLSGNSAVSGDGGNAADGGDGVCIGFTGAQSTMGGTGGNGGNSPLARGGTLYMANGTAAANNSTVALNTATPGTGGAAGFTGAGTVGPYTTTPPGVAGTVAGGQGGGFYVATGSLTLASTIAGDNTASGTGSSGNDIEGAVTANSSLIESPSGATITGASNVTADPQLVALANNGGPTQTHALGAASPAIDTGANALALANDQRGTGFPRTFGGTADIGAFERQTAGTPPPPAVSSPAAPVTLNANTFNIQGTAPAGSLVRVYTDINNDGIINGSDAMVASQQLTTGQTTFSIATSLAQNAANNFTVTEQGATTQSAPTDVPTLTEDSAAPAQPTIFTPGAPLNYVGPTYDITGNAEANSLVQIYRDANDNGVIDSGDTVVGSQQLTGGGISFSITAPLISSTFNYFVATATDAAANESTPVDVATITELTVTQAASPTITLPAAALTVNLPNFIITGTAQAGLLVRIYSDANDNGLVDGADVVVGSQQLTAGQTDFAITVTLGQDMANYFTATAEGPYLSESTPADVPTITDGTGFSAGPKNEGSTGCSTQAAPGFWHAFLVTLCGLLLAVRALLRKQPRQS